MSKSGAGLQVRVASAAGALQGFLALAVGVAVWEAVGRTLEFSFLPPLSRVVRAGLQLVVHERVPDYLVASLISLAIGYVLAASSGTLLGLVMGRYRWVEHAVDPLIGALLAAPKIVFVPVLYALFGVGRGAQVSIVFLSAFFVIVVSTMGGIRSVDWRHLEMARAYGASERQLFWKVLLPGAMPLTMAGLRLGMGRAVKGMIKGEMFIAVFGLGALLREYGSRYDSERVFAILLLVIGVALMSTSVVRTVERRLVGWAEERS